MRIKLLVVLLLLILGTAVFFRFNPNKEPSTSDNTVNKETILVTDSSPSPVLPNSSPSPVLPEVEEYKRMTISFPLTEEMLVGIWQQNFMMAAGWSNRYHFYPSGKYIYFFSQMDCAKRTISHQGTWKLNDNKLILEIVRKEELVGGSLVEASGSCAGGYDLIDAKPQTVVLDTPNVSNYLLSPNTNLGDSEGSPYPSILIGEDAFWKFEDSPFCHNCYEDSNEFPEPDL